MGIGRIFSGGATTGDFSKIFLGVAKRGEICFSHSKLRKQPFLLKFSKSREKGPLPSSDVHGCFDTYSESWEPDQYVFLYFVSILEAQLYLGPMNAFLFRSSYCWPTTNLVTRHNIGWHKKTVITKAWINFEIVINSFYFSDLPSRINVLRVRNLTFEMPWTIEQKIFTVEAYSLQKSIHAA